MRSLTIVVLSVALLAFGIPTSKRSHRAQVFKQCKEPGTVALTFDDGPSDYIRNVSDQLSEVGGKATFFLNGKNFNCIYGEDQVAGVRHALHKGHQIASHTWSHPHLPRVGRQEIAYQFARVDEAIERVTGVRPAFFRPPYGEYNDDVLEVAAERGQTVVIWDFDAGDSTPIPPDESKKRYDELVSKHPHNILILNHDVHASTIETVLPYAIHALKKANYRFVTVAECLNMAPYQHIKAPEPRNSSWTCQ